MDQPGISSSNQPKRPYKRVGIYRFLALISMPIVLVLALVFVDIVFNLNDIERVATTTNNIHLPAILSGQRTLINIESLRRFISVTYNSSDANNRREAAINAMALAAESVFETDSRFATYARSAQDHIRELITAKNVSDSTAGELLGAEFLLVDIVSRLSGQLNLPSNVIAAKSASEPVANNRNQADARRHYVDQVVQPLLAICEQNEAAPLADDCTLLQSTWHTVQTSSAEHDRADDQARALWRELDSTLRELSDAASTAEAELTYQAMRHINVEAQRARQAIYISGLLLAIIVLSYTLAIHRYVLAPIALASRNLRQIRYGQPTGEIPPVRIRELQDLLNLLPSLGQHLAELNARSGKLELEKDKYVNLSYIDALTGVSNRRSFDQQLAREHNQTALAILMIDVDMFKLYNDTLGHQAGDNALVAVAHAMKAALLRSTDHVFRYGGEEFTVILPDASEESAMAVAARILITVRELNIPHPASSVAPMLTVSIGVSTRAAGEALSDEELVERADRALYRAKRSGRNRICVYLPGDVPPPSPALKAPTA